MSTFEAGFVTSDGKTYRKYGPGEYDRVLPNGEVESIDRYAYSGASAHRVRAAAIGDRTEMVRFRTTDGKIGQKIIENGEAKFYKAGKEVNANSYSGLHRHRSHYLRIDEGDFAAEGWSAEKDNLGNFVSDVDYLRVWEGDIPIEEWDHEESLDRLVYLLDERMTHDHDKFAFMVYYTIHDPNIGIELEHRRSTVERPYEDRGEIILYWQTTVIPALFDMAAQYQEVVINYTGVMGKTF